MPDVMWQKTADGLWFEVHFLGGWYHRHSSPYQFSAPKRDNDLSEDWRYEARIGRRIVMRYWLLQANVRYGNEAATTEAEENR